MLRIETEAWSDQAVAALTETESAELPPDAIAGIHGSGLGTVVADVTTGSWRIATGSRIGVVTGDGWGVRVRPRLAIPRLMFLLTYSRDDRGWKETLAEFEEETELYAAIAHGFALLAERAISPAPLSGYVTQEETARAFRGRLRIADQIAHQRGLPMPLELTVEEFIEDIHENRMLLTATLELLRLPLLSPGARARLMRVRAALDGVNPLPPGAPAKLPDITRLNQRYEPALRLARLILQSRSVATGVGPVVSSSFVLDMNTVFEDFLSRALEDALARYGGEVRLQYGGRFLDADRKIRLKPDITWWQDGRCRAVIDAKYKSLATRELPNADVYQALAYATAFGLEDAWLIYAKDAGSAPRTHWIPQADTVIRVLAVDVEGNPPDLLAAVKSIAREIALGTPAPALA